MNLQVWLDQSIDVPHLVLVFGTIPDIFFYSDLVPRADVMVDVDYLSRYYVEEDADYLALRGDPRLTWSVSHGTYMRAFNSPVAHSYTAARTPRSSSSCAAPRPHASSAGCAGSTRPPRSRPTDVRRCSSATTSSAPTATPSTR